MVHVAVAEGRFDDWEGLHALLTRAFAVMEGRIDPPSSLHLLTPEGLAAKAQAETLLIAQDDGRLVGCAFLAEQDGGLYLGKVAAEPALQGRGIGRALVAAAERIAVGRALPALTAQSRVEMTETHRFFEAQGFVRIGATAHPGFDRPTSFTFRKTLRRATG